MNNPIINPRTKLPLSEKASSIIRLMGGASYYEGERQWPLLTTNFGANSEVVRALNVLERAALIKRTKPADMHDDWATHRSYCITDAARALLAEELARKKANEERRLAERHAESLRQEQEQAARKAAEDDVARKLAAFPALVATLRALTDAVEQFTNVVADDWPEIATARALLAKLNEGGAVAKAERILPVAKNIQIQEGSR